MNPTHEEDPPNPRPGWNDVYVWPETSKERRSWRFREFGHRLGQFASKRGNDLRRTTFLEPYTGAHRRLITSTDKVGVRKE